ncbi:MAG: WD40 repeat domain-containing protein [Methylococcales bacterium]
MLASHINKYFDDGHQDNVTSIAYSPDGKRIVSGSHDSTLILWDVATGKVIGQPWKGHQNLVNSVAFSPDGKQVISGSNDGTLILWDAETGKAIGQPWQGSGEVKSVAFSPNGKQVISGDEQGTLIMWDVASRKPIRNQGVTLKDGRGINSVAFSPNGKQFLSGDGVSSDSGLTDKPNKPVERMFGLTKTDNVINKPSLILWDVEKFGNIIGLPWKGHSGVVQSVAFSPDGQYVISGGGTSGFSSVDKYYQYTNDYTLMLWDVSSGKSIGQPWQGHQGDVNSVAFSPNGHFVISGSRDKNLILWNTQNGKIVESPWQGHRSNVNSVAFSPDGNQVVSGGGSYMGVDKKFAAEYRIILWNIDNRMVIEIPWKNDGISVAFSPDGKQAVSVVDNINNTLMLWNVASGKPIGSSWQGHQGQVISIAFSPDGKRVISGSVDGTLILWDVENSKAIGKFWNDSNKLSIRSVAFSPNGEFVICGNSDGTLVLWNAKTGRIIGQPWQGHQGDIGSVAFSADSKQVISGGEDKTLVLWDVETGKAIGQPWRGHQGAVGSVAFSPGGSWVISGVGAFESRDDDKFDLILWDVETGKAIGQPWQGHQDAIHSVAFSPDGKRVISSGAGDTLVLWDVETGKVIGQPLEQSFYHNCCGSGFGFSNSAFSSDGKQVVSAKYGVFGLWDVDSENWAARACKKANRNFTRAEWNQFIGEDLLPYQKTCEQFPLKD